MEGWTYTPGIGFLLILLIAWLARFWWHEPLPDLVRLKKRIYLDDIGSLVRKVHSSTDPDAVAWLMPPANTPGKFATIEFRKFLTSRSDYAVQIVWRVDSDLNSRDADRFREFAARTGANLIESPDIHGDYPVLSIFSYEDAAVANIGRHALRELYAINRNDPIALEWRGFEWP